MSSVLDRKLYRGKGPDGRLQQKRVHTTSQPSTDSQAVRLVQVDRKNMQEKERENKNEKNSFIAQVNLRDVFCRTR